MLQVTLLASIQRFLNSLGQAVPSYSLRRLTIRLHLLTLITLSKMTPEAEKFNGWAAMLGFVAAFGAYATTGQIIPGIF